jgi:hypothetical protein
VHIARRRAGLDRCKVLPSGRNGRQRASNITVRDLLAQSLNLTRLGARACRVGWEGAEGG